METTEFLFDVSAYTKRGTRAVPLRPPGRTVMPPEVWAALVRVKRALDDTARGRTRGATPGRELP